jgi:hypothetical protein
MVKFVCEKLAGLVMGVGRGASHGTAVHQTKQNVHDIEKPAIVIGPI